MHEIYLDNSATTMVLPEAAEVSCKVMTEAYGNPSSMHNMGIAAEKYIRNARAFFAKNLKVSEKELFFTSCGTESDNMAIIGTAYANRRNGHHIITTGIEHPAVLRTMEALEKDGFEVTYLNVDKNGIISLDELKSSIREGTVLVSIMHVNNEIGAVEPISEAGRLIKETNPKALFHVDAVQGYLKLPLYPKRMNIDLLSVSGHKIHAPKGIGLLYVSEKVKINPIIYGGGQQSGLRSGTENVPSIAAMAKAAELLSQNYDTDVINLYGLKKHFIEESISSIADVYINGVPALNNAEGSGLTLKELPDMASAPLDELVKGYGAPHIISLSVKGVRAEVLLHALEEKGIYVSSGSACSTHKKTSSDTLNAIGIDKALLDSTIRISMSNFTTDEEISFTLDTLRTLIPQLRKFSRK